MLPERHDVHPRRRLESQTNGCASLPPQRLLPPPPPLLCSNQLKAQYPHRPIPIPIHTPSFLINSSRSTLSGYVLLIYDQSVKQNQSLNIATSICGVTNVDHRRPQPRKLTHPSPRRLPMLADSRNLNPTPNLQPLRQISTTKTLIFHQSGRLRSPPTRLRHPEQRLRYHKQHRPDDSQSHRPRSLRRRRHQTTQARLVLADKRAGFSFTKLLKQPARRRHNYSLEHLHNFQLENPHPTAAVPQRRELSRRKTATLRPFVMSAGDKTPVAQPPASTSRPKMVR